MSGPQYSGPGFMCAPVKWLRCTNSPILVLQRQNGLVRSVDIAKYMGFSKPTISQYMKQYAQQGLVTMAANGAIELTEKGRAIAEPILDRHMIISRIFMALGVSEETAKEDACKVEHDLSEETFECLKQYYMEQIRTSK